LPERRFPPPCDARSGGGLGALKRGRHQFEAASKHSTVIVVAPTNRTSIRLTSAALNCVTGWAAVISTPSATNWALVWRTVSTLHRVTGWASIPCPIAVTVTVARRRWWVILSVGARSGCQCTKRHSANTANGQKHSRCAHCGRPPILVPSSQKVAPHWSTSIIVADAASRHRGPRKEQIYVFA
jgi:hypothetical protein